MSEDWTAIAAEVAEALGEFTTVTLIKPGAETGPENNPTVGAPTEHTLRAVISDYSAIERSGTLIGVTDKKVLIEAGAVVPTQADRLSVGGKTLEIVSVNATEPAGVAVMYEVQARG